MITADIETLEVFYAHTVSPVCIAVLVSLAVMVVTGLAASWYLSLIAAAAYLCIGVLLPRFFSRRMAETGMRYRRELGDFGAYFLDSIKGIRELVLYNAGETRCRTNRRRAECHTDRRIYETGNIFKSHSRKKSSVPSGDTLPSATRRWKRSCKRQRSDSTKRSSLPPCRNTSAIASRMNLCASRRRNRRCRDERSGYFAGAATGGISCDRKWREYVFFCARIRGAVAGGSPPAELSVRQKRGHKIYSHISTR